MDNFKQFNENTFSSQDKVSKTKVIEVESFTSEIGKLLSNEVRNGLTPFYLNDDYEFVEILLSKDNYRDTYPYKITTSVTRNRYGRPIENSRKVSLKNEKNKFGKIYLISEEDLRDIQPLLDQVKKTLSLIEKQKTMLIDLIGSKLTHK